MADIELTSENAPATPGSGATTIFVTKPMPGPATILLPYGNTGGVGGIQGNIGLVGLASGASAGGMVHTGGQREVAFKDDAGNTRIVRKLTNQNIASDTGAVAETYLAGSSILVPQHGLKVGTTFHWRFIFTKSTVGTGALIWNIKSGTAASTSDNSLCSFTFGTNTAAADTGCCEIVGVVRTTGTAGVVAGGCIMTHILTTTGFNSQVTQVMQAVSASTDLTAVPQFIGVSITGGTGASISFNTQSAEYVEAVNL